MDRSSWGLCPSKGLSVCRTEVVTTVHNCVYQITIHEHEKQLLILHTYAVLNHILTEGDVTVVNLLTVTFYTNFPYHQWWIVSKRHITVATKFFIAESNICESSIQNLLYVTLMVTTISTWLLHNCKICVPPLYMCCSPSVYIKKSTQFFLTA
jgi:hypothetical protein